MTEIIKKTLLGLVATVATTSIILVSCEKEESKTISNSNTKNAEMVSVNLSKYDIDSISKEVAYFHDTYLRKYLSDKKNNVISDIDDYVEKDLFNAIVDGITTYPTYASSKISEWIIDTAGYLMVYDMVGKRAEFDIRMLPYTSDPYSFVNLDGVRNKLSEINNRIPQLMRESSTYDIFKEKYELCVQNLLVDINDINEYACIRFGAAVYLNSFEIWIEEIYGPTVSSKSVDGWISGLWDSVVSTAEEVYTVVRPYVVADGNGAVSGAIAGALEGAILGSLAAGVGAGPGAASGFVGGGVGGAVAGSIGYHQSR